MAAGSMYIKTDDAAGVLNSGSRVLHYCCTLL